MARQILLEVSKMCKHHLYKEADKMIDALYNDYLNNKIILSQEEENQMFYLLEAVALGLYC